MANKDDYLTCYREFFEYFAQTVNPNDQLPVKLASYKLVNVEVVGGIIDWTTQYLTQKKCPQHLLAPLIKIVIEEIRKACKKQPTSCGFNPADNAYEPLKLMQAVMAKTNEVCLRYLDNSMLCSLPPPGLPYYITSIYAIKNTRRRMEDKHVVIHDLNTMFNVQEASPSSYYAVFDGHAGHDAAAYSSAHLHQYLAENKYFCSNPEQALLDAFCKTDALFIDKCKVENLSSGTTAVVALLRPKEKSLYIAWVGDSQALLVNQGRILQCVNPHKPSRQDERERIEKAGGCVMLWGTWRVNGQLAVSRAIGDASYKPFVTAIPDIREIPLDGGEDFLILACDGLWDFLSEDSAAQEVYYMVAENPDDTDRISQRLVQLSRQLGSTDNISVIIVFLREPSKIAAEAHRWANRNGSPATMDASLDNANNPFANSNGAGTDNILSQKSDGLLLNLSDNFRHNEVSEDVFEQEKRNGKRSASEFEDQDFGPETDVDAVDDAILSPVDVKKTFDENLGNAPEEASFNPFIERPDKHITDVQEKAVFETEHQKNSENDFGEQALPRDEAPTPPADTDVAGLEDNAVDSDSEDEWNYIKGEEAGKENISRPEKEVAEDVSEENNMSQLNPNAAEFVPISPTRSIPSPACRALFNDEVIACSPKRPVAVDINVPNESDFTNEVKSRPSEIEAYTNGHKPHDDLNVTPTETLESLLNGRNIEDIPEFHPGSTPTKVPLNEEFHFGPNAAPFTPKLLDQSEAALSTKAVFGDESSATIGTSFDESALCQDVGDLNVLNKESDPMSMSFYADKGESNPFDLNEVQVLPEDIDEYLQKGDDMNDTISDLPEHYPLGLPKGDGEVIQTTDLDKPSFTEEKELESPVQSEKDLDGFLKMTEISQKSTSDDLVLSETQIRSEPETVLIEHEVQVTENTLLGDAIGEEQTSINDPPQLEVHEVQQSENVLLSDAIAPDTQSPINDLPECESPVCELPESDSPNDASQPQVSEAPKLIVSDLPESDTPVCSLTKSPECTLPQLTSPAELPESEAQVCDLPESDSLVEDNAETNSEKETLSPVCDILTSPKDEQQPEDSTSNKEVHNDGLQDEITASVKDDVSSIVEDLVSPTKSPEPNHIIEESLIDEQPTVIERNADLTQHNVEIHEVHDTANETHDHHIHELEPQDTSSPIVVQQEPCDISLDTFIKPLEIEPTLVTQQEQMTETYPSKSFTDTESVATTDVNSFLDRSQIPDVASPLSPITSEMSAEQRPDILDLNHPLSKCVYPEPLPIVGEHIDVKTDNLVMQFPETTVLTPSEESKHSDVDSEVKVSTELKEAVVTSEPSPDASVAQDVVNEVVKTEQPVDVKVAEVEKAVPKEVKQTATTTTKKPTAKTTLKPTPKATSATKPATSRLSSSPKPAAPKLSAARPPTASSTTKLSPKPKTSLSASPKPIDKKPLTNGDVKTATKTTAVKKSTTEVTAKTSPRPASSTTARLNLTKTAATRPATAPRTAPPTRPAPAAARTATTTASRSATARPATTTAAPRPTSLASKTSTTKTTATLKSTIGDTKPLASPKSSATLKPKPQTSAPLPKPRVPLTKTITKATPDTTKQNKESANKLTASRTGIAAKTGSARGVTNTTTTTTRRIETKPSTITRTTVSKTTTTTMKSTTAKKPAEITKNVNKSKPTKIEKPKENGVAAVVKEITVVNVVNESENLVKDNSPIDNKLIVDNTLIKVETTD